MSKRIKLNHRDFTFLKEDVILHDALLRFIEAKRDSEKARARWYDRRAKVNMGDEQRI